MTQIIDSDSYLIIVGGDSSAITIADYSEEDRTFTKTIFEKVTKESGLSKALTAGYASPIAQNLVSKFLPPAVLGRVNSSLFDIIKDGKVKSEEVLEDFITSCTGELDSVAIGLGLPSPTALYDMLKPDGSGVPQKDFLDTFTRANIDRTITNELVQNTNSGNTTIIKMKLVISDNESYSSSLPKRRTEKGFNFVDYVNNEFPNYEFSAILGGIGNSLYSVKEALIALRKDKVPFKVFINDKYNDKQYMVENCLFSSLTFGTGVESANSKTCSMSFEPIPEGEIKTVKLGNINVGDSRNQKKGNKSVSKNTKVTPKKQGGNKTVFTWSEQQRVNGIKSVYKERSADPKYKFSDDHELQQDMSDLGTSAKILGLK